MIMLILVFEFLFFGSGIAETSLLGYHFVFTFPPNQQDVALTNCDIIITNPSDVIVAEVKFETPNAENISRVSVDKNTASVVNIDVGKMFTANNDSTHNNSINIVVENHVQVYVTVEIELSFDTELLNLIPVFNLDRKYDVIAPVLLGSLSFVSAIALFGNTEINVYFPNIVSVLSMNNMNSSELQVVNDDNIIVHLRNPLEVFTLRYHSHLTGLRIESNYKISVFSGSERQIMTSLHNETFFMMDQVPPRKYLGRRHIVDNIASFNNNKYIILSTVENTNVIAMNHEVCTNYALNKGGWIMEEAVESMGYIKSTHPIVVAQIFESSDDKFSMIYTMELDSYTPSYSHYNPLFGNIMTSYSWDVILYTCSNMSTTGSTSQTPEQFEIESDIVCKAEVYDWHYPFSGFLGGLSINTFLGGYIYSTNPQRFGAYILGGTFVARKETCLQNEDPVNNNCITSEISCPYTVPNVTVLLDLVTASAGGSAFLHCMVDGSSQTTTVSWTYANSTDSGDIITGNRYVITNSTSGNNVNTTLEITEVYGSDAMIYTCQAENSIGLNSAKIELEVTGDKPLVTFDNQFVEETAGDNAKLTCRVASSTTITGAYWTRTTDEERVNTTTGRFSINGGGGNLNQDLKIQSTQIEDTGVYNCHVTNYAGTTKGPDMFLFVHERATEAITPSATAAPGTSSSKPIVTAPVRNVTAFSGSSATLQCEIQGDHTSIHWKKIQGGLTSTVDPSLSPIRLVGGVKSQPSLTIDKVTAYDEAEYKCVAINNDAQGESEAITLDIMDQSVVTFVYVPEENKQEYLLNKTTAMKKELTVDKSTLSSTVRLKTSAPDARPSAAATGALGIILLTVTIGTMICLDIPSLAREIRTKSLLFRVIRKYRK